MKILVTGGGGFIGRHLVKRLEKFEVTVFDNESNCSKEQTDENKNINFCSGDIRDYDAIKNAVNGHDLVIHLAAKISVSDSEEHEKEEVYDVNVNGSSNVVKSCIENNISKLIVMSSAAVYGEGQKRHYIDENTVPNPISAYGQSKLQMENVVKTFTEKSNLNSIIFRLFNVYGPGQSDVYAGVIKKFALSAKNDMPMKVFGDGTQTRDFIHVDDVVEFIVSAISNIDGKKASIYNIGSGKSITINELANLIFSIFGKKSDISYEKPMAGDVQFSSSDITKIKNTFHYMPKRELKEGISKIFSKIYGNVSNKT